MMISATLPFSSFAGNTLVILLGTVGASEGTESERAASVLHPFTLSANNLQEYFLHTYMADKNHLLNLFDADLNPETIEQEMTQFLRIQSKKMIIQRIIFYYVGYYVEHGDDVSLLLQFAREGNRSPHSIQLTKLARILNSNTSEAVQRIILFDGYRAKENAGMADTAGAAIERIFMLPPDDAQASSAVETSVLYACQAASAKLISNASQPSAFSEALLYVLNHRAYPKQEDLSLRTVHQLMNTFLAQNYPHNSFHPILARSKLPAGPVFPNLYQQPAEGTTRLKDGLRHISMLLQNVSNSSIVHETSARFITAANIGSLQELKFVIPVQSNEPPKSLFIHRGKLYLSTPRFHSIDLESRASVTYTEQASTLDLLLVARGDFLYVRTDERTLSCFDAEANRRLWISTGRKGTQLQDAPLVANGIVYAVFTDVTEQQEHDVRAIDAMSGRVLWEMVLQPAVPHALMIADTHLLIRTSNNQIYGIDTTRFQQNWPFPFGPGEGSITFDPVVSQEQVYLVVDRWQGGSILYALDLTSGSVRWSSEIDPQPYSLEYAPFVHNDLVYVVSKRKRNSVKLQEYEPEQYKMHALAADGAKRWDYAISKDERLLNRPLIIGDLVYLMLWDRAQKAFIVRCINALTGRLDRSISLTAKKTPLAHALDGSMPFPPIVSDHLLGISCTFQGVPGPNRQRSCIFVLDIQKKAISRDIPLSAALSAPPLIAHGLLYVLVQADDRPAARDRARLVIIDIAKGDQRWDSAPMEVVTSPPVVTRDMLCFVTSASGADDDARYYIRIFRPGNDAPEWQNT